MSRAPTVIGGLAVVMLAALVEEEAPRARPSPSGEAAKARILEGYGRLPLRFERVEGQARYVSRGAGYTMYVAPTEMVLSLRKGDGPRSVSSALLRVKLLQSRSDPEMQGLDELPGKANCNCLAPWACFTRSS